jgi:hypothetical protein
VADFLYGPYQGPKDKLAKLTALAALPLANIEDEVQSRLGDMTMDDLKAAVAEIEANELQAAIIMSEQMIEMAAQGPQEQPTEAAA